MKRRIGSNRLGGIFFLLASLGAAQSAYAADGTWTNTSSGYWSDTSKWVGGSVAGSGGTATFKAVTGAFEITNDLGTVTLSGINANTDSADGAIATEWRIVGGTQEMVAPAIIHTRAHGLSLRPTTIAGGADLLITGLGRLFLGDDNLYTGRTIISNGNVRVARDSGFGPVPATLQADAIILDNGGLENDENTFVLTNAATRGITVTARGGFLGCGYTSAGFLVNAPVTGPGLLGINFENCPVTLNNPANDYAGDTVVGTNGPGANTACSPTLKLGQSEVLPHGAGKGGLRIGTDSSFNNTLPTSTLDLNGQTETVNTLASGPRARITSSVANQGRLSVGATGGDSDFRGTLDGGATIEKQGVGTLRVTGATVTGGTLDIRAGTVAAGGPNLTSGASVLFDGGDLLLTAPSGLYEYYGSGGATLDPGASLTFSGWRLWPEKGSETVAAAFVNGRQYVYRGKWHLPEAGVYSFAKGFDDSASLAIDGTVILSNTVTATRAVVNDVALAAGWHTVELRVGDAGSGVGPQFGFRNAILFDPQNGGFTNGAEVARARVFTDDGGTNLVAYGRDCVVPAKLLLAQDATLTVGEEAGRLVFAGLLATNQVTVPEPVLTVANGGAPLIFGSDSGTPAVLDAAVSSAGGMVLTNRVWLRRVPSGTYSIAAGADVALDGAALLGGPLTLSGYSVRVVGDGSVGGDGSVTANAGTAVWFDTTRYANRALADSPATSATYANAVALNGGTARFTGAGTITYSGALTGNGNAVKSGSGDLLLTGSGSSLNGEIQVTAGRLLPANEAALGGATVRVNGGRLSPPSGADLTLSATPVVVSSGGFEVPAGRTLTLDGQVRGEGNVSKWGDGLLVLGGTAINTNFDLHVRGGLVELNKSGAATDYAVRHLIGIATNLTVKLTGSNGNQIGGGVTLDGGLLDLNGRGESIGVLTNTPAGGTVTNSAASPATLTVGEGGVSSSFDGVLTDGAGALALAKVGTGALTLPVTAPLRYSGGTTVEGGTLRLTFSQPVANGLVYRLDASDTAKLTLSGSNVTTWADSTTNGYLFSQSETNQQPVYVPGAFNGLPAIRFGSGGSTRLIANKAASARTVFIVSSMASYQNLAGVWGQAGFDKGIRHANSTSWRHTGNSADANDFSFNGAMFINGLSSFSWGSAPAHVLTAVSTANQAWTTAIGNYWGPNDANGKSRYLNGYLAEILVYNRVLTTGEQQTVETYLKHKWFGGATMPAAQPFAVARGATLAVSSGNLTFAALSGAGTVAPETGNTVTLADCNSFTGAVAGTGTVALRVTGGTDVQVAPQSFGVTLRNDSPQALTVRVGTAAESVFIGSVQNGSNAMGIVHSGPGTTFFGGTNSTYTGATVIEQGTAVVGGALSARYVRFAPEATRTSGGFVNTGYQLSEFRLLLNGGTVAYPPGTLASCPGGSGWSVNEAPARLIDGDVNTKFYIGTASPLYPVVISLPEPVSFDGYSWYTANDATGRDPVAWSVDISNDGANWTPVSHLSFLDNQSAVTEARNTRVGAWLLNGYLAMNVFSDASPMTVEAAGTLAVSSTSETVGRLSGGGNIVLFSGATLGLNAFSNAVFTGGITGTGTVVKTGAAKQTLSGALSFTGEIVVDEGVLDLTGATLTGVTNIVVRSGGELTGVATVSGDLTVSFEGGVYSASLALSGALTVSGAVTLGVAEGATYPYTGTLFTYASADPATQSALLGAATPSPVPSGHSAFVRVTDTSARLIISPVGTLLTVQ